MGTLRILEKGEMFFTNRREAGKLLGRALEHFKNTRTVVLGIPRGGIEVAWEIANTIKADMDVVMAHKLGAPDNPEYALGAVSEDGKVFLDENVRYLTTPDYIQQEKTKQMELMAQRMKEYGAILPKAELRGKTVIITDDGIAMGLTMEAALSSVRAERPKKLIIALPVGAPPVLKHLSGLADETIALCSPPDFFSISQFYLEFPQVEDEEVFEFLRAENLRRTKKVSKPVTSVTDKF